MNLQNIRRAGVPLVAIDTSDPALTISSAVRSLNGKGESIPIMQWDMVTGLQGVNGAGQITAGDISPEPMMTSHATECLRLLATKAPKGTSEPTDGDRWLIFMHSAHAVIGNADTAQAIWNLRDVFKGIGATLVLLAPALTLPDMLKHDVVSIEDPLPDEAELGRIVDSIVKDAGVPSILVEGETRTRAVDALLGLSAFGAEQCLSMSISRTGIDLSSLWERKRKMIEQTPGMEFRRDTLRFSEIAGYDVVKTAILRKISGRRPPKLVLWLDELSQALAGASGDTSGVTQDQVGSLLTWLQDKLDSDKLSAMMLVGYPGTGKSAIARSTHNEAGCECIRLDMGGMKGSLVGESEGKVRRVLKTVDAIANGHILMIATTNSVQGIPAPLMSRMAFGVYMFNLPDDAENAELWKMKRKKYGISDGEPNPPSRGFSGREIQQCCFLASDWNVPLAEAVKYIVPFCRSGQAEIESLTRQATGRWISASTPQEQPVAVQGRRFA